MLTSLRQASIPHACLHAVALACVALTGSVSLPAQSLPTIRTAYLSGDAAPGTSSTFQRSSSLAPAYALPNGAATFTTPLIDGRQATYLAPASGEAQLFVQGSVSATLVNPALTYSQSNNFILNASSSGEIVARVGAGTSGLETASAFFTGSANAPSLLFRSGDTLALGAGTVPTLFNLISTRGGSPMVITRNVGDTASWLQIRRAGTWEATPLKGGTFEGQTFVSPVDRVTQANSAGQFLFRARTGTASADTLLLGQNGTYTAIARPGTTLPGHSRPALQLLPASLNQSGQVALRVEFTVAQSSPVAIPAESGLYLWTAASGPAKVFAPGDPVAALPGAFFAAAESALLADDGSVLFLATVEQGGVRLTGLFHRAASASAPITKVVIPGDLPPGLPTNLNVRRIDGYAYNNAGQLVFRATLAEVTQPPVALVGGTPHDLRLIAATGYGLETRTGQQSVTALGPLGLTLAFAGENTAQFNDAGQLAFSARFSGSPAPDGVFVATLPAATPAPTPTTAVLEAYAQEPFVIRSNSKGGVTRTPAGTASTTDNFSSIHPLGSVVRITSPASTDLNQQTVFHGWAPTAYDPATGFAPAVTTNPLDITLTADRRLVGFRGHPYADALGTPGRAWSSGGHALWTGTYDVFAPSGGGCARGTSLRAPGEESWLETTVTGPTLVRFAWRLDVSSGAGSRLVAIANGAQILDYATSTTTRDNAGWRRETVDISTSGPVTLRFRVTRSQNSGIVSQGTPFPVLNQETAYLGNFSTGTFSAPTALRSVFLNATSFSLGWTPGFGATSQTVELSTSPTFATIAQTQSVSGTATEAAFFSLTSETTYYARVVSVRSGSASLPSAAFAFTPSSRSGQTINFPAIDDRVFSANAASNTFNLSAAAGSGLPVTFTVLSGPATLSGNALTVTGPGTVTVEANQAGNSSFRPATAVSQSFEVTAGQPQTITFGTLSNRLATAAPFTVSATSSSGLAVAFQVVSGPATISGNTVTLTREAGTVLLRTSQPGGDRNGVTYAAATPVDQSFEVTFGPPNTNQTITFTAPATATYGDEALELTATASSELPVTFELVSGPAILEGDSLLFTGAGKVTVRATQPGSYPFKPATAVSRTITVNKAVLEVSCFDYTRLVGQNNPADFGLTYEGFIGNDSESSITTPPTASTTAKPSSPVGSYPITIKGGLSPNYTFAAGELGTITVVGFGGTHEALLVDEALTPLGKLVLTIPANALSFSGSLTTAAEGRTVSFKSAANQLLIPSAEADSVSLDDFLITVNGTAYNLDLTLDSEGRLTGAVTRDEQTFATLAPGARLYVPAARTTAPWTGTHTVVLLPAANLFADGPLPSGSGHASAVIDAKGALKLTGRLADGTTLTGTFLPDASGTYRLFVNPYGTRAESFLAGALALQAHPDTGRFPSPRYYIPADAGLLVWQKAPSPAKPLDRSYRDGFGPLAVSVALDPWIAPSTAATLPQLLGLAESGTASATLALTYLPEGLDLGESASTLPASLAVSAATAAKLTVPLPNPRAFKLSSFNAKTGAFSGTFSLSDQVNAARPSPSSAP